MASARRRRRLRLSDTHFVLRVLSLQPHYHTFSSDHVTLSLSPSRQSPSTLPARRIRKSKEHVCAKSTTLLASLLQHHAAAPNFDSLGFRAGLFACIAMTVCGTSCLWVRSSVELCMDRTPATISDPCSILKSIQKAHAQQYQSVETRCFRPLRGARFPTDGRSCA